MNALPTPTIRHILVICEGNHCRSPMAEYLLKAALNTNSGQKVNVESAGLGALYGRAADPEAERLMAQRGIDMSAHRGRMLTPKFALAADLILVMDRQQKASCEQLAPSARGRVFLLGHWLPANEQEIVDPFHRGPEAFREALTHIDQAVAAWLPRLLPPQRPA